MYSVYIRDFKRNGAIVGTEELMFTVPSNTGDFPVQKPIVKASEDSADNFSFSMESNSPYYDAFLQKKTLIRVVYDGPNGNESDIIFFGRVLTISCSTVFHTKNVTCEGYYAFLNDTYYEGKQEKVRKKISLSNYIDKIIDNHNTWAPLKYIERGTIGADLNLPNKNDKYEPTSWSQTTSLLSNLTSSYGGHMRIRFGSEAPYIPYLDWYKYYVRDLGNNLRPKVTVGKNILDLSSDYSVDNVFTRVIPIGDTKDNGKSVYIYGYKYDGTNAFPSKAMPVSFIRNLYTDNELDDEFHNHNDYTTANTDDLYGVIYKTISFPDANTQAKLWNYVKKWIKDCYYGVAVSFDVKAIDMHIQDQSVPKILLGECVDVTYLIVRNGVKTWETKKLVCKSVQYDLFNPENNSYTFGIPTDLLDHTSSKKKAQKKEASTAAAKNTQPKGDEDKSITFQKVANTILEDDDISDGYGGEGAYYSFLANGELTGTITCYDPNQVVDENTGATIGNNPRSYPKYWFKAQIIGKITPTNKSVRWIAISSDKGLFAYIANGDPAPVQHWYVQKSGMIYQSQESGTSSSYAIAEIIRKDPAQYWGGDSAADSFIANGKLSGTVEAYDTDKSVNDKFTADIIGKFKATGSIQTRYVAISSEFGIFGYLTSSKPVPVVHWYQRAKGLKYDNLKGFYVEETPDGKKAIFDTADDDPGGQRTTEFQPKELTYPEYEANRTYEVGALVTYANYIWRCKVAIETPEPWNPEHWEQKGSAAVGKVFIGRDLTSQDADDWNVELNVPIAYNDEEGNLQVADGFVSAKDFHLPTLPSFKSKLVVVDALLADYAKINTLEALNAKIDNLTAKNITSGKITADTWLHAYYIMGQSITAYTSIISPEIKLDTGPQPRDKVSLGNCFNSCIPTINENNQLVLMFGKAGGGTVTTDPFDLTATTWYAGVVAGLTPSATGSWGNDNKFPYTVDVTQNGSSVWSKSIGFTSSCNVQLEIDKNGTPTAYNSSRKYIDVPYKILQTETVQGTQTSTERYTGTITNVNASSVYGNGWEDAWGKVNVSTSASTNSNAYSFKVPQQQVDSDKTYSYIIADTSDDVTGYKNKVDLKVQTGTNSQNLPTYNTVARYTHGRYDSGWKAARASVMDKTYTVSGKTYDYFPSTTVSPASNRLAYIKVAVPSEDADGALTEIPYRLTVSQGYAYLRAGTSDSSPIVARRSHTFYNQGFDAVTLSDPDWQYPASDHNADNTTSSNSVIIEASKMSDNLTERKKIIPISLVVDTTNKVAKVTTDNGIVRAIANISMYNSSEYDLAVDNAEWQGKSSVSLVAHTWNPLNNGQVGASRTATVSTSGRTDAFGNVDNLSDTIPLTLVPSGLTVSLKDNGVEVAKATCSDNNLTAANIKDGVTIFDVEGEYGPEYAVTACGVDISEPTQALSTWTKVSGKNYYIQNNTSGASANIRLYLKPYLTVDGSDLNKNSDGLRTFIKDDVTDIYRDGYTYGIAHAPHDITSFGVLTPYNESGSMSGVTYTNSTRLTQNQDLGYYLNTAGNDPVAAIVCKGEWSCDGAARVGNRTVVLKAVPTAIYKKGYEDGRDSVTACNHTKIAGNYTFYCNVEDLYNGNKKITLTLTVTTSTSIGVSDGHTYVLYK